MEFRNFICFVVAPALMGATTAARVWEEPLTIPTYELGAPDPNPQFPAFQEHERPYYPYTKLDSLTGRKQDHVYKAVYLENEYLRVTVLPELDGRVYSIFDKTASREVLYTNHVVKYGIIAIRGAWISGGIEWNFPDGHTVTTVSPVDYATRMEPDGSATVTVGDTERVQRMQWSVTMRLRPGWKVLETEVTLNNRRETPGKYWFWATAAAHATDDLRFVYPMREAYPHRFWPVYSFPIENGEDVGTYRDVKDALSLFARRSLRDFFSVYYEKSDWGVVHVADHREVPGKKTWTWGTSESGKVWIDKLTDHDGQYVEFQAGRFETQMEHEYIAPHRVEHFVEHWFPVNALGGGLDEANTNGAIHVERAAGSVAVSISANANWPGATVSVAQNGKQIGEAHADLNPANTFHTSIDIARANAGPLEIRATAKDGSTILAWRTDTPVDGNADWKPATEPPSDAELPNSAEQAYLRGVVAGKSSDDVAARDAFNEALRRDPGYAPAHVALGLSLYESGEYEPAAKHLEAALVRNADSGDAHYYLGLVRRAQRQTAEAVRQLGWCIHAGQRESVARYELGEMALAQGNVAEAVEQLGEAVRLDPKDLKARTVWAIALRRAGDSAAAKREIATVLERVPTDILALYESGHALPREPDSALELMWDYQAAGQTADAVAVGVRGLRQWPDDALLHYTLGYLRGGDSAEYALGAKAQAALMFPHRREEIAVFQDAHAEYYLGCVLASKGRVTEALAAWRKAAEQDPSNVLAQRNFGLAAWRVAKDRDASTAAYRRAIALAPDEFHLYVEAMQVLTPKERIALLESAPPGVRAQSSIGITLASAYLDAGRFEDAISVLASGQFTAGEGDQGPHSLYVAAHLGLARKYREAGEHAKAANEFIAATLFPANLGVGRSSGDALAPIYADAEHEFREAARWRVIGPGGGGAQFFPTISPHDAQRVLVACDMTGSYVSNNAGASWRMFNLRDKANFFVFDPVEKDTMYAEAGGLWRSTDAGVRWELVYPSAAAVQGLEMGDDHASVNIVAKPAPKKITALAIDRALYASMDDGLYRSDDRGESWTKIEKTRGGAHKLYVNGGAIYQIGDRWIGVWRDGQWTEHPAPEGILDSSGGFAGGNFIVYATNGKELNVSNNSGATWERAKFPGDAAEFRAVAASERHGDTAYVSYQGLQEGGQTWFGVARTQDGGATWKLVWRETAHAAAANVHDAWIGARFGPSWSENPLSLGVSPVDPNVCYGGDFGRTMRTTDGGKNWDAVYSRAAPGGGSTSNGMDVTTNYGVIFDPFDRKRVFIPYTDIGLFRSEDGGESWISSTSGVPDAWLNTTYSMVFDPAVRGRAWAAMSGTHDLPRPKMWRRTATSTYLGGVTLSDDGGRSWKPSNEGMAESAVTHVLLDPRSPVDARVLYAAAFGRGVYKSVDGGKSWRLSNEGITQREPFAWRLAQDDQGILYLVIARRSEDGRMGADGDGALYRSSDGAAHWERMTLPTGVNGPNGLAIDARDSKRLYLAAWRRDTANPKDGGGIFLSTDGGASWRLVLDKDQHVYDVTVDPRDPDVLYACGFESSAWRSNDRGETWTRIRGYNFKWGHRVVLDPVDPRMIYVTTFGGSVWHGPALGDADASEDIATPQLRYTP